MYLPIHFSGAVKNWAGVRERHAQKWVQGSKIMLREDRRHGIVIKTIEAETAGEEIIGTAFVLS